MADSEAIQGKVTSAGGMMTVATYINAHKILVIPVVLGLMWFYDNWSTDAFIYLSIHGTYSILWLLKHSLYADRRFEHKVPLWTGTLFIFLPLAGYYIAPYLLISRHVLVPPRWSGSRCSFTFWASSSIMSVMPRSTTHCSFARG